MKSKHIYWTLDLKCDHQVWPWPWPWPWIFKVKYGICYMSSQNGLIALKLNNYIDWNFGLNCNHQVWTWPWPWIFKIKCDLHLWHHTWPWPRIFMVKFLNSCISECESRLTLNKGGGSRSFITKTFKTMTIWWPRSGVRIFQIVTGVISDVGVLSIHLVSLKNPHLNMLFAK